MVMETGIRQRLRSAAKSGGSATEEDVGRPKSTLSTAYRGGSEPRSLHRLHTEALFSRPASTVSLSRMFDSEVEEAATEEVVTSERAALQEADVTAGATEECAGCAPLGGSSDVMASCPDSGPPLPAAK